MLMLFPFKVPRFVVDGRLTHHSRGTGQKRPAPLIQTLGFIMPVISRSFALVFQQTAPESIFQLFHGYVDEHKGMKMVFCQNPSYDAGFVSVQIKRLSDGQLWEVQIPQHYVLAILDASEDRPSLGFVRPSQ